MENDWEGTKDFHAELKHLLDNAPKKPCVQCGEMWPTVPQPVASVGKCQDCTMQPKRTQDTNLYSWANQMHPGVIPPELQGLIDLEELLIGVATLS